MFSSTLIKGWKNKCLYKLIKRVYWHIFKRDLTAKLFEKWIEYKQYQRTFSDDKPVITKYQEITEKQNVSANLIDI